MMWQKFIKTLFFPGFIQKKKVRKSKDYFLNKPKGKNQFETFKRENKFQLELQGFQKSALYHLELYNVMNNKLIKLQEQSKELTFLQHLYDLINWQFLAVTNS